MVFYFCYMNFEYIGGLSTFSLFYNLILAVYFYLLVKIQALYPYHSFIKVMIDIFRFV